MTIIELCHAMYTVLWHACESAVTFVKRRPQQIWNLHILLHHWSDYCTELPLKQCCASSLQNVLATVLGELVQDTHLLCIVAVPLWLCHVDDVCANVGVQGHNDVMPVINNILAKVLTLVLGSKHDTGKGNG